MDLSGQNQDWSKKLVGIGAVVAIHLIVIYALLNGLGKQIIAVIQQIPVDVQIIQDSPPAPSVPPAAPVAPPKVVTAHRPVLPKPEAPVRPTPISDTVQADFQESPPPAAKMVTDAVRAPVVVNPVVDFATCAKPEYPRNSLRNEEQGTVRLQFLIGVDGRVADAKMEKSSGFRALDNAAKNALRLCKFKPGTIDGKPQQSWTVVDYVWKLPD